MIDKAKAVAFIKSANKKMYGKLLPTIREQHLFKINVYPNMLTDAYEILSSHIPHNITSNNKAHSKNDTSNNESDNLRATNHNNRQNEAEAGASYLQDTLVPGTVGRLITYITCYNCGKKGITPTIAQPLPPQ